MVDEPPVVAMHGHSRQHPRYKLSLACVNIHLLQAGLLDPAHRPVKIIIECWNIMLRHEKMAVGGSKIMFWY
jgi:hypothetical protein